MAPLLFGLLLAYGVAGFGFGVLNILTAFVGAILHGIGVDNGIHLLGRFEEAQRGGASTERAVRESFADAGRVSVAAESQRWGQESDVIVLLRRRRTMTPDSDPVSPATRRQGRTDTGSIWPRISPA
jgi:hypothetical protein